jgi:hypothetical protein
MTRRGQQGKRAMRKADRRREKDLAKAEVYGEYTPPPRSECFPRHYYEHLDDDASIRVDVRTWAHSGQVVDFHLTIEVARMDGLEWSWQPIARVDICHGHAHAHALVGSKTDVEPMHIARIDTVDDVHDAMRLSSVQIITFARTIPNEGGSEDG